MTEPKWPYGCGACHVWGDDQQMRGRKAQARKCHTCDRTEDAIREHHGFVYMTDKQKEAVASYKRSMGRAEQPNLYQIQADKHAGESA